MFCKNDIKNPTCFGHYYMTILRDRTLYLVHYHFSACLHRHLYGAKVKIVNAKQARLHNNLKNTKCKLLRTNAAVWRQMTKQASGEVIIH
jgi:hypothetical protein